MLSQYTIVGFQVSSIGYHTFSFYVKQLNVLQDGLTQLCLRGKQVKLRELNKPDYN